MEQAEICRWQDQTVDEIPATSKKQEAGQNYGWQGQAAGPGGQPSQLKALGTFSRTLNGSLLPSHHSHRVTSHA